jgi:hypothetical protein
MAVGSVSFGSGLNSEIQILDKSWLKMCNGLIALIGHQNLMELHHTNHWSHRCDMKLFGSNKYGVMAVGSVSFGSGLNSEILILDKSWLKMCHTWLRTVKDHQNLMELHLTNHWPHMCDMKLFDSNKYGVMTVGSVSFGSGLITQRSKFWTNPGSKCAMASHGEGPSKSHGTSSHQSLAS